MTITKIGKSEYFVRRNLSHKGWTVRVFATGVFLTADYGWPAREPPNDIAKALLKYLS